MPPYRFGLIAWPTILTLLLAGPGGASDVITATDATFEEVIQSSDVVVMVFYAPWCGHCTRMVPAWEELAKDAESDVTIAKLDCDAHRDLGSEYGVRGFPTNKFFPAGEDKSAQDFNGARDVNSFKSFIAANKK